MRRSTRSTTKRAVPTPTTSDEENEPSNTKLKHKTIKKTKSLQQKSNDEENSHTVSNESCSNTQKSKIGSKKSFSDDHTDSSSESDIENYLKPADKIDLNSSFFHINKTEESNSFEAIENDIFSGINRLSDSESESEKQEINDEMLVKDVKPEKRVPTKKTPNNHPKASKLNFQQLHDYTKKLEEAKKIVEKYEANRKSDQRAATKKRINEEEKLDISNLLALGEAKPDSSGDLYTSMHSSDFESMSDSEKEDWEEVQGHDIKETNEDIVSKEVVQITVALPGTMRKKKGVDLVACMKRRLNRIRKEHQVLVHKVHLLCWLGHGNYVNQILNNNDLLALALSLIPSQHCYPSNRTDLSYLEQIVTWYKDTMPNVEKLISKELTLDKALKLQINRKQAFNKKMLVYIFICILRSLGIQCRLIISFQIAPLRPPASELHSLSTKSQQKNENDQTGSSSKKDLSQISPSGNSKTKTQKSSIPALKSLDSKGQKEKSRSRAQREPSKKSNSKIISKEIHEKRKQNTSTNSETAKIKADKKRPAHDSESITKKSKENTSTKSKQSQPKIEAHKQKSRSKSTDLEESQHKAVKSDSLNAMSARCSKETSKTKTKPQQSNTTKLKPKNVLPSTSLKIPQVDGADDSDNEKPTLSQKSKKPNLKKLSQEEKQQCLIKNHPKRLRSLPNYTEVNSDDDFQPEHSKKHNNNNIPSSSKSSSTINLKKLKQIASVSKDSSKKLTNPSSSEKSPLKNIDKLKQRSNSATDQKSPASTKNSSQYFSANSPKKQGDVRNDIISIMKDRIAQEKEKHRSKLVKSRKSCKQSDDDSDYAPEPVKTKHHDSDDEFYEKNKVKVKQRVKVKNNQNDDEPKMKKGVDVWVEVYLETEEKWISADVIKGQVHSVNELYSRASHPVTYIMAWNNDNSIKDITQRYCPNWNTVTRKLRVDKKWLDDTLKPYVGPKTARDKEEDEELARLQLDKPLPTTISEYKNHPLYVLKRHLLKFEALYPPEPITLGFIRNEPVYSRDCVHTLHSREVWIKYAKVVRPGEQPYKIVKARPKYDRLSGQVITDKPLEIFGEWQVGDYVPPVAENGVVPRNEYGNVELFKPCMLPKGTVHLQLPGLNKVARKMNIDCAPAMVGFDFHSGGSHPVYDGFVVCEEHSESIIAAWYIELEEQEKREQEKIEKRVYDNWKKLIKGLLIRERLKARYNFGEPSQATGKKRKPKGPKLVSKKRRLASESDSDEGA